MHFKETADRQNDSKNHITTRRTVMVSLAERYSARRLIKPNVLIRELYYSVSRSDTRARTEARTRGVARNSFWGGIHF